MTTLPPPPSEEALAEEEFELGPMECGSCHRDVHEYVMHVGLNSRGVEMQPWCMPCIFRKAQEEYLLILNYHRWDGNTWVQKVRT